MKTKSKQEKHDKPVKKVGIPENKSLPSYTQVPYPPSPLRPMKTRIFSSAVIRIAKEKKNESKENRNITSKPDQPPPM